MNAPQHRREIAIVDTTVEDHQSLIDAAEAQGMEIIRISGDGGMEELGRQLEGREEIDALHLFSHGSQGQVHLGGDVLSSETLNEHSDTLAAIGRSMTDDGDILLYGCSVGADAEGQEFIKRLATATGADVAASDDATGAAVLGGDWTLETSVGLIEADRSLDQAALQDFRGILETFDATGSGDNTQTYTQTKNGHTITVTTSGTIRTDDGYIGVDENSDTSYTITFDNGAEFTFGGADYASVDGNATFRITGVKSGGNDVHTFTDAGFPGMGTVPTTNLSGTYTSLLVDEVDDDGSVDLFLNNIVLTAAADTTPPTVTGVAVNHATVSDSEVGNDTFTVTANFDEPMDTGVAPTISFPTENPTGTLTFASGNWTDSDTYVATYDVTDANIDLADIDVRISGGQDTAGNTMSAHDAADKFSIDTAAPAVPTALDLDAASDTGTSDTDDLTNDTTPTISGSAEANSTVTLYDSDGTTSVGSTTAAGDGSWSITASTLGEGTHNLTAKASPPPH